MLVHTLIDFSLLDYCRIDYNSLFTSHAIFFIIIIIILRCMSSALQWTGEKSISSPVHLLTRKSGRKSHHLLDAMQFDCNMPV